MSADASQAEPAATTPGAAGAPTLDRFLEDIGPRAFRFAELGLRQREDALDAVQEALMRMLAYRERPALEWTQLFWRILRSRIVDQQRRGMLHLRWLSPFTNDQHEGIEWADSEPEPAQAHDHREAYAALAAALRNLPRRQREAFSLRVLEELDVATTARVMECSQGSVKTHLSRARAALQKQLEELL